MAQSAAPRRILGFGSFEVDLASGELRRQGLKIRLQDQPLRLLVLLLERAGEVVTREELRTSSGRRTRSSTSTTASTRR